MAVFADTFISAKPDDLITDHFEPTAPLARLKLSSTGDVGGFVTTAVGAEAAWLLPALLEPVTTTLSVKPPSLVWIV